MSNGHLPRSRAGGLGAARPSGHFPSLRSSLLHPVGAGGLAGPRSAPRFNKGAESHGMTSRCVSLPPGSVQPDGTRVATAVLWHCPPQTSVGPATVARTFCPAALLCGFPAERREAWLWLEGAAADTHAAQGPSPRRPAPGPWQSGAPRPAPRPGVPVRLRPGGAGFEARAQAAGRGESAGSQPGPAGASPLSPPGEKLTRDQGNNAGSIVDSQPSSGLRTAHTVRRWA